MLHRDKLHQLAYLPVGGGQPAVVHPAPNAVSGSEARPVSRGVLRIVHNIACSPGFGSGAAGGRGRSRGDLDLRERLTVSVPVELAQGRLLLQPGLFSLSLF